MREELHFSIAFKIFYPSSKINAFFDDNVQEMSIFARHAWICVKIVNQCPRILSLDGGGSEGAGNREGQLCNYSINAREERSSAEKDIQHFDY
jgi:hypothetical protein